LPIAFYTLNLHTERSNSIPTISMNIALLSDEILMRHLYAILCTMFHRYELYRVEFLYKLIGQIEVHIILSFTETQSL
jgi:hypothetical protein